MMRKPLRMLASAMMFSFIAPLVVMPLFVMPEARADFPDTGPPLRKFDPKKDCDCVFSALKRARALRDGYRALAESYRGMLKDLGDGKDSPAWVDPNLLSEQQMKRLGEFNKAFDAEEQKMAQSAPASDCGFPEGKRIVLETSSLTGSLPTSEQQNSMKPLFPFEELYDAVMLHEAHHSGKFFEHNSGSNKPAGKLPGARTPYGRALEEAEGYEIEIRELEPLQKQCKVSFKDVKLNMRSGTPPNELVITNDISGFVCGDPYTNNWTITVHSIQTAGGTVISEQEDPPWDTDCVAPGSAVAKHYENVMLNSSQNYLGWYCLYTSGNPPKVTLRTPKLTMSAMYGMETKVDPPKDHTVDAEIGACQDERAPEKKEDTPPVPVS